MMPGDLQLGHGAIAHGRTPSPHVVFGHNSDDTGSVPSIGERIKKARLAASLSQRELAKRVGVSFPHISKIEAGQEKASDDLLRRIAVQVGIDEDDLLLAADRLPDDISKTILAKPDIAPEFLRSWSSGEISDEDVQKLLRKARDKD